MYRDKSFARFVTLPENRTGLTAVRELAHFFATDGTQPVANPLCLLGPTGSGKTHLVHALIRKITSRSPHLLVSMLAAHDFDLAGELWSTAGAGESPDWLRTAKHNDLLVVEDLQHLAPRGSEPLVQLLDYRLARNRPVVLTARLSPQQLGKQLPARLTNRMAAGLVVALEPWQTSSRLLFLQDLAKRRHLSVRHEVLTWLARHFTGGGRMLEGALTRLEALSRLHSAPVDVGMVARHLGDEAAAARPTVERIAQRVGGFFQVEPRRLQSRRRSRHILWPRQVGMYLARRLTDLSLEQIGAYFGGRDHATVLHACRKVEETLQANEMMAGNVRQLQADLG
jgi:chromosomal replication initiator protein